MNRPHIAFAIHDLHQRGGQDRSTLEIIENFPEGAALDVHSFTFEGTRHRGETRIRTVRPNFRKPALLKIFLYHVITAARFLSLKLRREQTLICATGACSLISDIIHVQFVHAAWERKRSGARSFYHRFVARYNLLTERITFRKNKGYIAISEQVKRELEAEYGLKRVSVVRHGVDGEKFHPLAPGESKAKAREALGIEAREETLLLYVGTYERKGLATVINAFSKLKGRGIKNLRLLAVGQGDQEKFRRQAEALGVGDKVQLLSPRGNIEEYFRAADVFVFPTAYEPFGLVILEAMASGLACVVSRAAGAAELIEHDKSGLLLEDPADARELTEQLAKLAEEETRLKMGQLARAAAEERSWPRVAEEYQAAVRALSRR